MPANVWSVGFPDNSTMTSSGTYRRSPAGGTPLPPRRADRPVPGDLESRGPTRALGVLGVTTVPSYGGWLPPGGIAPMTTPGTMPSPRPGPMILPGPCGWIPMPRGPSRMVPGGKGGRVPALVPVLPGPSRVIPVGTDDQVLVRGPIPPNPPRTPPIFIGGANLPIEIACAT